MWDVVSTRSLSDFPVGSQPKAGKESLLSTRRTWSDFKHSEVRKRCPILLFPTPLPRGRGAIDKSLCDLHIKPQAACSDAFAWSVTMPTETFRAELARRFVEASLLRLIQRCVETAGGAGDFVKRQFPFRHSLLTAFEPFDRCCGRRCGASVAEAFASLACLCLDGVAEISPGRFLRRVQLQLFV